MRSILDDTKCWFLIFIILQYLADSNSRFNKNAYKKVAY
jgi:hypothetical protein